MQIEHWAILAFVTWVFVAITFIRACIRSDKRSKTKIEDEVLKNKTVFFVEHNHLQREDLDFQSEQQPTIVLPERNL
jgi:hypothetical protein